MADAAPAKSPAKKRSAKPKKPASHPKYADMIRKAIKTLAERNGSSRQAIAKYICANYKVDANKVKSRLRIALRAGVNNNTLKQSKGTGASGSFRIGDKGEKKAKKPKAKKVKKAKKPKSAAKKVRKPKAAGTKKSPKKAKKPKAAKKSPKKASKPKAAKKSPAKKAAKPKKAKSPKKAKK